MVIKPDYRGHGKSGGSPEGGHFSPVYAYDNLNLVASLKEYSSVNPNRIGLFGHSLGGHVALRTIVASKDIKATVIMAGAVGSIYDLLYNWPNSPMPGDEPKALVASKKQELINKYGDPKANPTFWNSASAINYVDGVAGKVQLHHSVGDSTVPHLFSDNLATALQKAGKSVENYTYPGDDHQFAQNRSLILQRTVAFYKASL
jgi:dipeptidyl aminopeptidase/acylaminoacyl peptidase